MDFNEDRPLIVEDYPGLPQVQIPPDIYRVCPEPADVIVTEVGRYAGRYHGQVLGWRGDRCYVTFSSGVGARHLTWVKAEQVERYR